MASAKETPRQKMIGMMYLVLTALLALNVSKDILDAFVVVNKGLENTNLNFTDRNDNLYAQFDLAKKVDPVKVTPNWQKAQEIKKQSLELFSYIDKLQKKLISETDGIPEFVADTIKMANLSSKDNYDIPTNVLIGDSEDGSKGASRELKNKLDTYKVNLVKCILPKDQKNVTVDINTEAPSNAANENWEMYNFYHRPLVASLTILSKLKNDVKNAESTVVDYLLKQVDKESLKFDSIAPAIIPQSNYVLLGEEYKADIFLAAFNKTKNPDIIIDNSPADLIKINYGVGKYNLKTSKEGVFTYSGTIKMKSGQNQELSFPFKSEYIVARPMLTVSADSMNAVYLGIENPISVSVPGIPNEKLSVTVTNADVKNNGNGSYILNVKQGPKVAVNVFATMENGEKRNMGTKYFRVKYIPKPVGKLGGVKGSGTIAKTTFATLKTLDVFYENFVFNAKCTVKSFTFSYTIGGGWDEKRITTNSLTTIQEIVKVLPKNTRVVFENIKAIGPDKREVNVDAMTIKLN